MITFNDTIDLGDVPAGATLHFQGDVIADTSTGLVEADRIDFKPLAGTDYNIVTIRTNDSITGDSRGGIVMVDEARPNDGPQIALFYDNGGLDGLEASIKDSYLNSGVSATFYDTPITQSVIRDSSDTVDNGGVHQFGFMGYRGTEDPFNPGTTNWSNYFDYEVAIVTGGTPIESSDDAVSIAGYTSDGDGAQAYIGSDGVDTLYFDTAFVDINRNDATGYVTTVAVDDEGEIEVDVASGVERFAFNEHTVAFDDEAAQVYRLYRATYDRTPDTEGLSFWVEQRDKGMTLNEMSEYFVTSDEFETLYGGQTSEQVVGGFYENIFDRTADGAGFDFWVDILDRPEYDESDLLSFFSESQEGVDLVAPEISDGIFLI